MKHICSRWTCRRFWRMTFEVQISDPPVTPEPLIDAYKVLTIFSAQSLYHFWALEPAHLRCVMTCARTSTRQDFQTLFHLESVWESRTRLVSSCSKHCKRWLNSRLSSSSFKAFRKAWQRKLTFLEATRQWHYSTIAKSHQELPFGVIDCRPSRTLPIDA